MMLDYIVKCDKCESTNVEDIVTWDKEEFKKKVISMTDYIQEMKRPKMMTLEYKMYRHIVKCFDCGYTKEYWC